jgi:hypothetical protein
MTSIQHPTRRQALRLAGGTMAMAALPVPVLARLQAPIAPSANVLWKPVDNAPRVMASSDDLFMPAAGA